MLGGRHPCYFLMSLRTGTRSYPYNDLGHDHDVKNHNGSVHCLGTCYLEEKSVTYGYTMSE